MASTKSIAQARWFTRPRKPVVGDRVEVQFDDGNWYAGSIGRVRKKETTVKAYDLDMVLKGRRSQVGSLCVTAYLHLKKGMVQPLVANVIMGLVALLRDPLVRVHVLGEDVERPFAPPQPAWLKAMQAQQAEAAAKAAEEGAADAEEESESEEGDDDAEEDAEEEDIDEEDDDDDEED